MIQLSFLSATAQGKVEAKLAEIEKKSGSSWACEVTEEQQLENHGYLLEVTIDGRFMRPVSLPAASAEVICSQLDQLYEGLSH